MAASASRVRELIMSPSAHAPRRCAAAVAHGCSCWQTFAMARWPPVAGAVPPSGRWSGGGASRCGEPTIGGVVRAPTTAPSAALLSDSEMRSCSRLASAPKAVSASADGSVHAARRRAGSSCGGSLRVTSRVSEHAFCSACSASSVVLAGWAGVQRGSSLSRTGSSISRVPPPRRGISERQKRHACSASSSVAKACMPKLTRRTVSAASSTKTSTGSCTPRCHAPSSACPKLAIAPRRSGDDTHGCIAHDSRGTSRDSASDECSSLPGAAGDAAAAVGGVAGGEVGLLEAEWREGGWAAATSVGGAGA
mmetsp:Transcript_27652/g.70680  ORF Transcript_27652/g.70680 Transcript_27652/m.70680 type:complete len:308 (-) Transcript_27652:1129-2052(-)